MYINELEPQSRLVIRSGEEGQEKELETSVMQLESGSDMEYIRTLTGKDPETPYCLLDADHIPEENGFHGENAKNSVCAVRMGTPFIWKNVMITRICLPSFRTVLLAAAKGNAIPHNRRLDPRFKAAFPGNARKPGGVLHTITVVDISESGMSFLSGTPEFGPAGTRCEVLLSDGSGRPEFSVAAEIVRVEPDAEAGYLYGCRVTADRDAVGRYIKRHKKA
jgi:hypothetical protein